jgi:hypothetical protein
MKVPPVILTAAAVFWLGAAFSGAETNDHGDHAIVSRIRRQPVKSSALAAVGYSSELHVLEIEFRNGAAYRYLDVPKKLYRQLMAADSKARFYDQHIRGRFRSLHVRLPENRNRQP